MKILESALCSMLKMQGYYVLIRELVIYGTSRIMDKHLKTLAARHLETKFIRLDAEVSIFLCLVVCMCALSSMEQLLYPFYGCAVTVRYKFKIFFLLGNDVQNAPFFVGKLGIKTLPCVILFRSDKFLFVFI